MNECHVDIGGNYVGTVSPQSFVGEMSFLELLDMSSGIHRWPRWVPRFLPGALSLSRVFGEYAAATVYTPEDKSVRILSWKQSKVREIFCNDRIMGARLAFAAQCFASCSHFL